jgi:hypothetical protein
MAPFSTWSRPSSTPPTAKPAPCVADTLPARQTLPSGWAPDWRCHRRRERVRASASPGCGRRLFHRRERHSPQRLTNCHPAPHLLGWRASPRSLPHFKRPLSERLGPPRTAPPVWQRRSKPLRSHGSPLVPLYGQP